jgi:hypothetical protein
MKKKLILSIISFFICCTVLSAQARFVIAVDGLKMRSEPDLTASSIMIIPYGTQVEPREAIVSKSPSQSLLIGTWYRYDPYCLEEQKFTGNPYDDIGNFSNYHFDQKGNYSERHWEGGAEGGYILSGGKISIEGKAGYIEMEDFSEEWDISFYQIRTDWLIMEVMIWREDHNSGDEYLWVFFLIKPLSSQAQQKIDNYFEGSL